MNRDITVRLLTEDDAERLVELLRANAEFFAPYDPAHEDDYLTVAGQHRIVTQLLARHAQGTTVPFGILEDGELVGRITVNDIVRGPFQSAHLGYWVDEVRGGRGVASAAVAAVIEQAFGGSEEAFGGVGLHRLQAGTLVDNVRSQRVLLRNGFQRFGLAPRYLRIAGRWQDHILYQRLNEPLS